MMVPLTPRRRSTKIALVFESCCQEPPKKWLTLAKSREAIPLRYE
jgi:hypothetical protein